MAHGQRPESDRLVSPALTLTVISKEGRLLKQLTLYLI
jgi:hypothetical protein